MPTIRNLPEKWDIEADLVAVGSGIGGLSAAITAHDNGAKAIVLERSGEVGGVTALSQGQVWISGNHHAAGMGIEDSAQSGFRYLRRLSMGYGEDEAILNLTVHARLALKYFEEKAGLRMNVIRGCPDYYYGLTNDSVSEGRLLEVEPFPGASLGEEWQPKTRLSPQVPYALTTQDIADKGGLAAMIHWDFELMGERIANDMRCAGSGLAAYFVKAALDRGIPLETGVNVEGLIGDGERVVGVRATRDGQELFIKANKGVVIAVSSYERNRNLERTLGNQLDSESMLFSAIDGANMRLAGPFGAKVARVPEISMAGFSVPGEETDEGLPVWRSAMPIIGLPHHIVVNSQGKRFGNEGFYRSFYYMTDIIDGVNQTHPNFPCWIVIDSQAREKYAFVSIMPGQDWPKGFGVVADTIEELAREAGIDPQGLAETVARFNGNAEKGVDPDFGRGEQPWGAWMTGDKTHKPNANLGPIVKPPFYAVRLSRMGATGIPAAGLKIDRNANVVGWDEAPIPGLYAAGNSAARMESGAVMQSGVSNARGMTYGWLAALHAVGRPSELLEQEIAGMSG
ncbi:MAG: FAD-binding protein [Novosphingobium sp.]|nr:FAD-binding protein [Novosphingobium sp.]MCP5401879.1 FAD-binding protein [Novosphingobium sp.]